MQTEKQFLDLNADELDVLYLEQKSLLGSDDPEVVRNARFMMEQIQWATDRFYSKKKTFREREPGMYKDDMMRKIPKMEPRQLNKLWKEHEALLQSDDPTTVRTARFILDRIKAEVTSQIVSESTQRDAKQETHWVTVLLIVLMALLVFATIHTIFGRVG